MLIHTLRLIVWVGGVVLLILLCLSGAGTLADAAFAGNLPAPGWMLLSCLVLTGTGCASGLLISAILIIYSALSVAADVLRRRLRAAAAHLRGGR